MFSIGVVFKIYIEKRQILCFNLKIKIFKLILEKLFVDVQVQEKEVYQGRNGNFFIYRRLSRRFKYFFLWNEGKYGSYWGLFRIVIVKYEQNKGKLYGIWKV